jgi:glycosyltransferase involved in cell wall biosynthesis
MFVPLALTLPGMRIPLIASEHTNFQQRPQATASTSVALVLGLVNLTTCVSEQVRQTYPKSIRKRMVIFPNPVTRDAVVRADVAAKDRPRKRLLSVGRLDAGKDHSTLIEAFAKIAAEVSDWDLRIIREGVLRPKLEGQIAALGLATRISLPGATRDIASEYRNAQLFVMPRATKALA